MERTHETCCAKKRCIMKKQSLGGTTRAIQRAQVVTNGYFGGCIGKRQPAGTLEIKKCVDK
eukprot:1534354-Pyramimonas_sp.AAC.1